MKSEIKRKTELLYYRIYSAAALLSGYQGQLWLDHDTINIWCRAVRVGQYNSVVGARL